MTPLRRVTATVPACFGVCCPQHARCTRYAAIDGLPADQQPIATCEDGDGLRPLFREAAAATWSEAKLQALAVARREAA